MPKVEELFILAASDGGADDDDDDDETLDYPEAPEDPVPFWPSFTAAGDNIDSGDFFVPIFRLPSAIDLDEGSEYESNYYEDTASLALDLFDRRPPPLTETLTLESEIFRALDGVEEMGSDYLGLALGFDDSGDGDLHDDFFSDRRISGETPVAPPPVVESDVLRVVGLRSDSDVEDEQIGFMDGLGPPPLCFDCIHEEDRNYPDEDFEWEEVDGPRPDHSEILSMMVGEAEDESYNGNDEEFGIDIDWEVLVSVNMVINPSIELEVHEAFMNASEYEILIGQFTDHDSSIMGSPPAAKLVVENLPSIVLTEEDLAKNNTICAVCKDEIFIGEGAKQLPCLHHYHGDCILPWLGIRNTCPVCRYELPTDDADYEHLKSRRASGSEATEASSAR